MRFDNEGIALWYGTSDAPAPDGIAPPGESLASLSITIGVTPPDPSNTVQVRYRVNGGTPLTTLAAFLRADGARRAQYFRVWLPQLQPGDQVEYTATCQCVGRQVPAPAQAAGYLSSFKISADPAPPSPGLRAATGPAGLQPGGTGPSSGAAQAPRLPVPAPAASSGPEGSQLSALAQPQVFYAPTSRSAGGQLVAERLNQRLGDELRRVMGRMSPGLQQAVQAAAQSRTPWSSVAGQRIADHAAAILTDAGKDPQLAAEAAQVHARVAATATPTVAEALCLDAPLRDNPALHEIATRGMIVEFASVAGLGGPATQVVVEHSAALASGGAAALDELVGRGELSHGDASALDACLELAKLTDDNLALIRALRAAGAAEPASLTGWTREHWQQLISGQHIPVPPGDTPASYADAIVHNLETAYPAHTLAAHTGDSQLAALLARNPSLDLRHVNLVAGQSAHLDWTGVPAAARPAVERELRSSQRLIALADDTEVRLTLKRTGYDSAIAVAAKTEEEFIRVSGLGEGQARLTYARAQETALSVASHYGAVRDLMKDAFKNLAVENVSPLINDLRQIEGLSDLFGPQDFCDCDDCHSVLSPAAYFTDLMHFVETNVSQPVFIQESQTLHPLYLKRRRPDLWSLRLTCENTHTLIPYLTIVNEVLEAYLGDVVAGDIYQQLSDPADRVSFRVPFSLPFAELRLYLGHFGLAPADIYRTLGHPDAKTWRARLGLSPDEATVIAQPDPEHVVSRLGSPAPLGDYDLQAFLRSAGLQRDQLDSVLASRFNPDLAAVTVTSKADPGELQNFAEILQNLTAARVDFIHRFVRLWRATSWQIPELDQILIAARDSGLIGQDIDDTVVQLLGRLTGIQATLRLGVEELCALVGELPVSAAFPRQPSLEDRRLYERLFDLVTLFGPLDKTGGTQIPGRELAQALTYHHYSLNTLNPGDTAIDPKTPLLLGSLGISETDLLQLLALLKDQMPFDTAGNCTLDRRRLSLLYRHVRVARALNLRIEDFVQALQLLFGPSRPVLTTLDQIEQLTAFTAWLRTSPFSIAELGFILEGAETGTATYANTSATVAQLIQQVQSVPDPGRDGALRDRLAAIFGVTAARLADTLAFIQSGLTSADIQTALTATFTDGTPDQPADLTALLDLVRQVERVVALFSRLKLDDEAVSYLRRHPGSLGIADIKTLTRRDIQSIGSYHALTVIRDNAAGLVQPVLDDYASTGSVSADSRAQLASLWQMDQSLLDSLCAVMALPAHPIDALSRLRDGLSTCLTLGTNGYSLKKLGDDTSFAAIAEARDVAIGAFSAKYPDETARTQTLQPYQDQINTVKRDALCDYILARQADMKFRDRNEIYDFFLLDVDTGGCFRTSRVVSAISSVQLYVQRCMLNLEQTDPQLDPAVVAAHVDPTCIPADEWEWRKNYRVWEANRKVFLYPESYTDPDLLDIKTPLLADLEDDLLQQEITSESASAAYQLYLTQFTELAHLRIAGTYYRAETSTYYFFGRTQQDPPVYYWRTWDGTTWSPWQKIDLAIDAPAVAAEFHLGRLYLFWVDGKSKDHTSIKNGCSQLDYYEVTIRLLYSTLNANGKWLPPQKLDSLHPVCSQVVHTDQTVRLPQHVTDHRTVINNRIDTDDALRAMELSKTYRNVYPKAVPGSLVLRYYNDHFPGPVCFDRQLDLFHNKLLKSGHVLPGLPSSPVVLLYTSDQSAQLGLTTSAFTTEAEFDMALEQSSAPPPYDPARRDHRTAPAHTYITTPFPYNPFTMDEDHPNYLMNLVHNRYPEAVLTVGDQDYLIHETLPASPLVGPFPQPAKGTTTATPAHPAGPGATFHPPASGAAVHPAALGTVVHPAAPGGTVHPAGLGTTGRPAAPGTGFDWTGSLIPGVLLGCPPTAARAQVRQLTSTLSAGRFFPGAPLSRRTLVRLSTSLADDLGEILMEEGLERLLALETQRCREKPVGFTITDLSELQYPADSAEHLNFNGAFGNYYRELYLHVPWLIARHLRANGRFEDAMWWYRRIFDPTASESPLDTCPNDRNWRYIEFRDWTVSKLRALLTDNAAISAYKHDPFNPHAIARLRPSAYQKAIVMDTVGTLIDWGDSLFAQDTMESVTEAGMLYVLASEILGTKPARLGKCHTVNDDDLTYEKLGPAIDNGSEFLLLLENWSLANNADTPPADLEGTVSHYKSSDGAAVAVLSSPLPLAAGSPASSAPQPPPGRSGARIPPPQLRPRVQRYATAAATRRQTSAVIASLADRLISPPARRLPAIPIAIQSTLAFCVPPNQVLLSYWDRVEDRLFKIRNCMNISGVRRQLALFQPPIDPMNLVRARAAGLSLDEALTALEAPVPPYRFAYLIDRARQAAQTVQSFGASLLSALEKKDIEELTLLRSLHERAVLRATKDVRTRQVQEAEHQCQALAETVANVQIRIDYYNDLISGGLSGSETTQQVSGHAATKLKMLEGLQHLYSALAYLLPQLGSPFAMKYGGKEAGDSARGFAELTSAMAGALDAISASAGLQAGWQRRDEEWRQQLLLAQQELKQVEQQRLAADIRTTITARELDIHQTTMDQADELDEFYKGKFTGLGLYNYLATTLTRLHHEAYNAADDLARMAQRAYQFERDDDTEFVAPDNWQFDKAGLLAGERLTLQLQQLENAYLARNARQFEITQSFSLALIDPGALLNLRETGSCEFTLPEILFDLAYPGQYKRILSGVRLTIPCVTGPYTNVSAKLTLQESKVRKTPTTDPSALMTLPVQTTPSIAASTGTNDSGQFEFSFRDERYLPFEGAGAISTWRLDLPSRLRLFDYATIPDVILHLSYRALDDGAFHEAVESGLVDTLTTYAATAGMHRLFSLRHDFPDAFYQLLHPAGTAQETHITLGREHFPYFLAGQTLTIAGASLFIQPQEADPADTTGLTISLNNNPATTWTTPPNTNLRSADIPVSGPALADWTVKVTAGHLDPDAVNDVLLLLKYTVT